MKISKKYISLILISIVSLVLVCQPISYAKAADTYSTAEVKASGTGNSAGTITWTLYEDGVLVFEGSGAVKGNISQGSIPWYAYSEYIKTLIIGEGITSIGLNDFAYCMNMTSVTLPDSLTQIGANAFLGCIRLVSVNVTDNVSKIGSCAFENCYSLEEINIPEGITEIGATTFKNCQSLTSIKLPSTLVTINANAFYCCSALTEIVIPDSVETIYSNSFYSCENVKSLYIGKGLSAMPAGGATNREDSTSGIFYGMDSLESIVISSENKTYDSRDNCNAIIRTDENKLLYGITNSTIPDSVKTIGTYAFRGADFTEIDIPDSVETIESYAFYGTSLASVEIPKSVKSLGTGAFADCNNLLEVYVYSDDVEYGMNYSDTYRSYYMFGSSGNSSSGNIIVIYGNEGSSTQKYVNDVIAWAEENEKYYYYIFKLLSDVSDGLPLVDNDVVVFNTNPYYNGQAQTVTVDVYHNNKLLKLNEDYTIEFSNNVNAGNAVVTVTGIGKYYGTIVKNFTIKKAVSNVSLEDESFTYVGDKEYGIDTISVYPEEAKEKVHIIYYSDSACTKPLSGIPREKGIYYVKAYIFEADNWLASESEAAVLTISNVSTVVLDDKTTAYTGAAINIDSAHVIGSNGSITYQYYTNAECTEKTDSSCGAKTDGAAPSEVGKYYVIAHAAGDEKYEGADSNIAVLTIEKAESTIVIQSKTAKFNGSQIGIDEPKISGSSGEVTVIYYIDENMTTRTTLANSGASKTGGEPIYSGTYYVRASVSSDQHYNRAVSDVAVLVIEASEDNHINTVAYKDKVLTYFNSEGIADYTFTGFCSGEGSIWYVENGIVSKSKTALISGSINGRSAVWYVKKNKVDLTYTGFASVSGEDWYVQNGCVTYSDNGIFEGTLHGESAYWYVENSRVIYNKVTVAEYSGSWWYVGTDGKVNSNFNGIAANEYGSWYICGGNVIFTYSGLVKYQGKYYSVINGKASLKEGK